MFVWLAPPNAYADTLKPSTATNLFLIRESSKGSGQFALSLLAEGSVWHYKIEAEVPPPSVRLNGWTYESLEQLVARLTREEHAVAYVAR